MVVSRSTRENIPYVLLAERELPADQQTTFKLASLSHDTLLAQLQLIAEGQVRKWVKVALAAGLRGWTNFRDADGNETEFRRSDRTVTIHGIEITKPVTDKTLDAIPSELLLELAQAIVDANQATVDDAKN
jgi:hypothetical protein